MRRVGKGTRIAEYAFIPRFSEKTSSVLEIIADGRVAIAHRGSRDVRDGRWSIVRVVVGGRSGGEARARPRPLGIVALNNYPPAPLGSQRSRSHTTVRGRSMSRVRPPGVAPRVGRSAFRPIATETQTLRQVQIVPATEVARLAHSANWSSSTFASLRSRVSNPSVNHP